MLTLLAACGDRGGATVKAHDAGVVRSPDARVVVAPVAADAAVTVADAAPIARPSARCKGLPDDATIEALPGGFHVTRGDDRWLVLDGPKACEVIPVGRAEARTTGAFWPGAGEVKAFAMSGADCDREDIDPCDLFVALRDEAGHVLDVTTACASRESTALIPVQVFDDLPSILVVCRILTGYGYDEDLSLLHVVDGHLSEVLRVFGGWADHGPSDACTGCKDYCFTQRDPARWRVLAGGDAPELETLSADAYGVQIDDPDVPKEKNLVRWKLDRAARKFVATKRTRKPTTAARGVCAKLEPQSPLP